ncbi:MAG: hypothetical protein M1837_005994 [Sclerophora amabilis]|nr:MAG: hypothetical protein M1837_005994 [Sclerophora amabilis]
MSLSSRFRASSSHRLLPQYEHEMPILARSMAPPSVLNVTSSSMTASAMTGYQPSSSHFLALERQEKQLQRELQVFLDAQSEGLIAGLTGKGPGDNVSEASSTPGTSVAGALPSRSPMSRPQTGRSLGLRGARKGILAAMQELAAVKREERDLLDAEGGLRRATLDQVELWEKKKEGLVQGIAKIERSEGGDKLRGLRGEEESLKVVHPQGSRSDKAKWGQKGIHHLETHLYELKAKHRHVASEISELENSLEAKESSYKASLSILESDIQRFLTKPPLQPAHTLSTTFPKDSSSFLALNPKRRTLDLAKDHFHDERETLARWCEQTAIERDALEDGSLVWSDVVTEVTAFEKRLRAEMRKLGNGSTSQINKSYNAHLDTRSPSPRSSSLKPSSNERQRTPDIDDGLPSLLTQMSHIITRVSSKLALAEARDWKLLVCCIGAELEAFKEGKEILKSALQASSHRRHPAEEADNASELLDEAAALDHVRKDSAARSTTVSHSPRSPQQRSFDGTSSSSPPPGLLLEEESQDLIREERSPHTTEGDVNVDGEFRDALERSSDDEDQGPDPELLVSRPGER